MLLLQMIFEFFKTGLFAIGGGLATIPFLKEMSMNYGWFTLEMLQVMISVAESTPGPIGINMATYVGFNSLGVVGGVATTLSLVAPSIIVIVIVAKILDKFKESKIVKYIFAGIKPAVLGLVVFAVSDIFIKTLYNPKTFINPIPTIIYLILLITSFKTKKLHPIMIIVICAALGIVLGL